ncbi:MAG: RlmE family RNA methyltransferase [Candidatus Bathyarchaeia archaeon]
MKKHRSPWIRERLKDQYHRMAKREGYRSRAAYKLLEINSREGIIKAGDRVLDLGAAPGGWIQVASECVGEGGYVLGIDVKEIEPLPLRNVETIISDIEGEEALRHASDRGPFDVVLCDASPKLSGAKDLDRARQFGLSMASLRIAKAVLRRGGHFLTKAFEGPEVGELREELRKLFSEVKILKPKASKSESSEIYVLAKGFMSRNGF